MKVYFDNHSIRHKEHKQLNKVQFEPTIKFDKQPNTLYTIIMIDPDAPSKLNPIYKHWLHWLIINNDLIIMPFLPSDPLSRSGLYRYYICLFKQKHKLSDIRISGRKSFNVGEFVKKSNLEFVDGVMYETSKNNITTVNWSRFINNDTKTLGNEEEDGNTGFAFSDEKTQEYQELIEAQIKSSQTGTASIITTDDGEIIDVDDI